MATKQSQEISIKAWIGIVIGTFLIGSIIFAQFNDPGMVALIVSFVIGFFAALLSWGLCAIGYEATARK